MTHETSSEVHNQETTNLLAIEKKMHCHYCKLFMCRNEFAIFAQIVQMFSYALTMNREPPWILDHRHYHSFL